MIALNIVLMTALILGIAGVLAWAIASDRRSKRAAGGTSPSDKPLHHDLVMPHEVRARPSSSAHRAGSSSRSSTA
jgi:hypothetical protein